MKFLIGKLWFESFEYHLKTRKRLNHLSTRKQYIDVIKDTILNYDNIFYANEKNGYGNWIDKIYFGKDRWTVIVKFDEYNNFNIITSFKLDNFYKNLEHYLISRNLFLGYLEVKDGSYYKGVAEKIQGRVKS